MTADNARSEAPEPESRPKVTFSMAEAAEMLGVGEWWLAEQARAGKVPHIKLGRTRRFSQANIEAIIAGAEQTPQRPAPSTYGMSPRSARYHSR
jgi:excisionase family DNA binding protein